MAGATAVILKLFKGVIVFSFLMFPLAHGAEVKPGWQAEWDRTVEAAKKEGQVVLYSGTGYPEIFADFRKNILK